ncbi:unnamed protein product, partial [Symbiodinium sp. KB8]
MSSRAQTPEERERRRKEKEAQLRKEAQEEFNTNWIAPKGRPIDKIRKLQYKGGTLFSPIKTKGEQQWETGSKVAGPNLTVKGMEVLVKAIRDGMDDTQTQLEGWEAVKTACSYIGVEELPESHDPVVAKAIELDIIGVLRRSMTAHISHPGVQEQGLGALANFAINGEKD